MEQRKLSTEGGLLFPSSANRCQLEASPSPLSSRAYPDFLPRCAGHGRVCAFRKERRMKFANATKFYGNPGQPRDLQFSGPLVEMFCADKLSLFIAENSPGSHQT